MSWAALAASVARHLGPLLAPWLRRIHGATLVRTTPPGAARNCGACRHFRNDAAFLERASPGLAVLSSAYGTVRAQDGICTCRARYVPIQAICGRFQAQMR